MRVNNIDRVLINDTLKGSIGKRIALELESGEMAEGVVTKVRTRRVHLSSPAAYGINESIVNIDEIMAVQRIDISEALRPHTR